MPSGVFEDEDVTHIEGDINPMRDMEIIFDELRLKDEEYIGKKLEALEKLVVRGNDKTKKGEYVSEMVTSLHLTDGQNTLKRCVYTVVLYRNIWRDHVRISRYNSPVLNRSVSFTSIILNQIC